MNNPTQLSQQLIVQQHVNEPNTKHK